VERLPEGIDSRFRYVLLVAMRAEQLIQGAPAKIRSKHAKPTRVAMDEIGQNKVRWQLGAPIESDDSEAIEVE
jgi:DNA-directed RNA polymerase subunit K/omega